MNTATSRVSQYFGIAQTALLIAYALVVFLTSGPPLFASALAAAIGNVLNAIGIVLIVVAIHTIRQAVQVAPAPKPGSQLVQSGVYRYLRHPIYTAIVCCAVGLFLKRPTLAVAMASAIVIIFLLIKVRFEEKLLLATYPDYAGYRTRAHGVLPWLGL